MPTNSYNNQLVLSLNGQGFIEDIVLNSYQDIEIKQGESVIHLFDDSNMSLFYEQFSQFEQGELFAGFQAVLSNSQPVYLFMIKHGESIMLFGLSLDEEIVHLFDEMVMINNEQVRSIRTLYQRLSKQDEDYGFLEEIMKVNNELINARRDLANKNRQLERLNDELEKVNRTDYLTGIPNRRGFFEDVYTALRENDYHLVMMDFNNFKIVNDKYGHDKGDELLQFFADKMNQWCEEHHGSLYRLGGDEFAVLLPQDTTIDLPSVITKMDQEIQRFDPQISIAYGVVEVTKDSIEENHRIEESMKVADQKMYQIKELFHQEHDIPLVKKK